MDIEELGLSPELDCEALGCNMACEYTDTSQCPVLALVNKMEMEASKAKMMKDGDKLVKRLNELKDSEAYREYKDKCTDVEIWRRYTFWLANLKDKAEGF